MTAEVFAVDTVSEPKHRFRAIDSRLPDDISAYNLRQTHRAVQLPSADNIVARRFRGKISWQNTSYRGLIDLKGYTPWI